MSESSPGRGQPQPPPPVRSSGVQSQAQEGQSERRRHRGPRNPRSGNQNISFQGKEEKLKGHVFDVLPYKSGKLFTKVTREIAEYAGREYPNAIKRSRLSLLQSVSMRLSLASVPLQ